MFQKDFITIIIYSYIRNQLRHIIIMIRLSIANISDNSIVIYTKILNTVNITR